MNKLLSLLLLILISCSAKNEYVNLEKLNLNDFKIEKKLKGDIINFEPFVMRPSDLLVIDSLLVTIELAEKKLFHIYNLNTKKKIAEVIYRGQGPNDMIMPQFLDVNDNIISIADMATSTIYKYYISDFIKTDNLPVPFKITQLGEMINTDIENFNDNILCSTYSDGFQLSIFDPEGNKIKDIIEYPPTTSTYTNIEKRDAFYMNFTTNRSDRIILCYYMTDLIKVYDQQANLYKRIHGPDHFFSHVKEYRNGEISLSTLKKGLNRDAYFSPENAGDEFMVLYNGGYIDDPDHSVSCNKLFSFNWNGKPNVIYNIDDPIFSFTVDAKNKKIYGISETPEYHIVEYSYK
jgi:hypothetical protein